MVNPLESSKYSISQAKRHLASFEREGNEFFANNPYAIVAEADPDGVHEIHKYRLVKDIPYDMRGFVTDTAVNLRSALDQVIYGIKPTKNAFFPIGPDLKHFENSLNGWCKHLPKEILDLVRSFKPYKGGDDLLWALNELANTNKHGVIRPVASASALTNHSIKIDYVKSFTFSPAPLWDRTKNEMILARSAKGDTFNAQFQFANRIAICDIEFIDGKPALAILNELVRKVESIAMAIEAEAKRIGLV